MGCVFGRRDEDRSVSCTLVAFVMEALRFLFWRYVATVVTELTCVNEICVCVCVCFAECRSILFVRKKKYEVSKALLEPE